MFLFFVRISKTFLFFLEYPPSILGDFTWRLQRNLKLVIVRCLTMETPPSTLSDFYPPILYSFFGCLILETILITVVRRRALIGYMSFVILVNYHRIAKMSYITG